LAVWLALKGARRSTREKLDGSVGFINSMFVSSKVLGPLVLELYPEESKQSEIRKPKTEQEKLVAQEKIVMLLHQLNYFRTYWSAATHFPPLVSAKDWRQNQIWFKETVWPWIKNDKALFDALCLLFRKRDFQEGGFAIFLKGFLEKPREFESTPIDLIKPPENQNPNGETTAP
jgi:hypothetical protein